MAEPASLSFIIICFPAIFMHIGGKKHRNHFYFYSCAVLLFYQVTKIRARTEAEIVVLSLKNLEINEN